MIASRWAGLPAYIVLFMLACRYVLLGCFQPTYRGCTNTLLYLRACYWLAKQGYISKI